MAKTKGGERARRQARQAKRARAEEQAKLQQPQVSEATGRRGRKAQTELAKPKAQAPKKDSGKPGLMARLKAYLADVKAEMRRVVWPSKRELRNYAVAVICLLIVFGVAVWLVDTGVVAALVGYAGLRG